MLKTNSKKARENAKKVFDDILYLYDNDGQDLTESAMLENMIDELIAGTTNSRGSLYTAWFPTVQDGFTGRIVEDCYCYTEDARQTLAAILEETEEEAARYDTDKVYRTLGAMLYKAFSDKCQEMGKDFINRYNWR